MNQEKQMPTPAYISMIGMTQGEITKGAFTGDSVGNGYVQGHEDEILIQEIQHSVGVPTDPQSGQPSGPRVHKPFIFTSSLNKATPLMYQALATGERLSEVSVRWYRTSTEGGYENFFSTVMEDATIVEIDTVLPHAQVESNKGFAQLIKVSLSYRSIAWVHEVSGTVGADDWRKPVEA
jgi:type VI secretion system secreted protein Hcp